MTTSGKPEDIGKTDSAGLACPTCGQPAAPPADEFSNPDPGPSQRTQG